METINVNDVTKLLDKHGFKYTSKSGDGKTTSYKKDKRYLVDVRPEYVLVIKTNGGSKKCTSTSEFEKYLKTL